MITAKELLDDAIAGLSAAQEALPLLAVELPEVAGPAGLLLPLLFEAAVRLRNGVVTTDEQRDAVQKQMLLLIDQAAAARFPNG